MVEAERSRGVRERARSACRRTIAIGGRRCGQQTTEFALIIGLAAIVAVSMQWRARQAIRAGLKTVTNITLGEPPADPDPAADLNATSTQTVQERGDSGFRRVTTTSSSSTGTSVNEDARTRPLPPLKE
ncbi:MAG: hypothetical protein HYZ91_07035 [Candidatus Omnitrophica bacterium]|nr:hypothetical protein [Candidatus Omnitrophota bacterium]